MAAPAPRRPAPRAFAGMGMAATGIACPCHVIAGIVLAGVAFTTGSAPALSPEQQDGVHALYLPAAVLLAAYLLGGTRTHRRPVSAQHVPTASTD